MSEEISAPVRRVDHDEKCRGEAKYVSDLKFDGMLYAKTVRSTRPRAKIVSIDIPPLPEGYFIVDRHDVPGRNRVRILIYDQPFFAEEMVNYIGEPILLVVGPDPDKIAEIIDSIRIEYEDLPAVFTIEQALEENSPRIFGEDNCFVDYKYTKGDPDDAFSRAAKVIRGTYRTGYQEHLYIEPQGVVGICEDGKVTVYGSMQCPYYIKRAVAEGLGWEEDRVRVVQVATGGAFGGKEEYPSLIGGQVAFAALKTGRPVKLIFDRDEDILATTKRHPSVVDIAAALDKKGNILAFDVDVKFDAGAYAGLSDVVLQRGIFAASGVYNIPNLRVRGRAVATNNVPTGAFRGFGGPQVFFAVESHMDRIAEELGVNPLDLRKKYLLKKGDTTCTGGLVRQDVKLPEMIDRAVQKSDYYRKWEQYRRQNGKIRRGIGISLFYHGCGFTGDGENRIRAKVTLRRRADGKYEILVANTEMGQGAFTTLRKIAAHALGVPLEDVIYDFPDTDRVPDSGPTVASRTTMIVGGVLKLCADEMKKIPPEHGEVEVTRTYQHPDFIKWDQKTLHGDSYPTYSFGVNVVEVEVDTITGEITPIKVWAEYDVGVAVDERLMRGQIDGGIVQGLGYALLEIMEAKDGLLQQHTITDYIIPTVMDVPEIESETVENPYDYGPFGAKCAGELTFVGAAPAAASAVRNATGKFITKIPIKPEEIIE